MRSWLRYTPIYLLLAVATLVAVLPFLWMFLTAIKSGPEVYALPPTIWPHHPTFANFAHAWGTGNFPRLFLNSAIVATLATVSNVLLDSMAAFAFARVRFPGRDWLFAGVLATMMLPAVVTVLPLFLIVKGLPSAHAGGWLNSYAGIVAPGAATAFGIFLFRQYFQTVPIDIDEAATLDGASMWRIYWQMLLPLAKPAAVTVAIFTFVYQWNDFLWPLVVATDSDMYTVQVGLSYFTSEHSIDWPLLMSAAVIVTLPVLLLYLGLQKYFVGGLTAGGLKE
ncbi:MAG TPA: carbohydrate ABC transporter permease [Oscillatoriaceae cyanobacterium]